MKLALLPAAIDEEVAFTLLVLSSKNGSLLSDVVIQPGDYCDKYVTVAHEGDDDAGDDDVPPQLWSDCAVIISTTGNQFIAELLAGPEPGDLPELVSCTRTSFPKSILNAGC